ncbi:MAG: hypothetical protein ABIR39_04820 [Nocardioides sp.]|uniref:hypothetical protein n=1 Tax=Nocardioides sp. TaxID=35761 RepID=UPI003265CE0B
MMRSAVLTLVLACALSACASGTEDPGSTATPTPSETPTETVEPTVLAFGAAQTVAWAPTAALAGELSISVEKVRAGDFADFDGLEGSGITEANQPFYVDALIANDGDVDLGGRDVPLYLQDSNGTLSPPWGFATPFKPCDSGPFPVSFAPGAELETCLVFFASPGGSFESVTFQPTVETAAVSWTGDVAVQEDKPAKKRSKPAGKRR